MLELTKQPSAICGNLAAFVKGNTYQCCTKSIPRHLKLWSSQIKELSGEYILWSAVCGFNHTWLKVIRVLLHHGKHTLSTYAVLDDGSVCSCHWQHTTWASEESQKTWPCQLYVKIFKFLMNPWFHSVFPQRISLSTAVSLLVPSWSCTSLLPHEQITEKLQAPCRSPNTGIQADTALAANRSRSPSLDYSC